jgi:hypothetical protein
MQAAMLERLKAEVAVRIELRQFRRTLRVLA